jgi:hypothetical protein
VIIRSRPVYWAIALGVVVLGLASRHFAPVLPPWVGDYAGDTLWALLVYLGVGLLRPAMSTLKAAAFALAFCYAIELSQLYHAPWIDQLRQATFGLILGFGFLWSDLVCYTLGIGLGATVEWAALRR